MQCSCRAPIVALPQPSRLLRFLRSTILVIAAALAAAVPSRAQQATPYSINPGDSTPPVVTITPTSEPVSTNTLAVNVFTGQNSLTETYTIRSFKHLEGVSYALHVAISGTVVWDSVAQGVFVDRDSSAHVIVYSRTFWTTVTLGRQTV